MYGYLEDYETIIECAKRLQDHIEDIHDKSLTLKECPQVSISLGQCAAFIEVDEIQVWYSEVDSLELTAELLIELFTNRCIHWSQFVPKEDDDQ